LTCLTPQKGRWKSRLSLQEGVQSDCSRAPNTRFAEPKTKNLKRGHRHYAVFRRRGKGVNKGAIRAGCAR